MNQILKSHTILPTDVCNIILEYANTIIEKDQDNRTYHYNNTIYKIRNYDLYCDDELILHDISSFAISVINGVDCLIIEDDKFIIKNLANGNILSSYKQYDGYINIRYHNNYVYFSTDTCESDNDATYLLHVLEIDADFKFIRKYCDNILGIIEYLDNEIIILQHKYAHCINELHIYSIDLMHICTIDIRRLPFLYEIIKSNSDDELYYIVSGGYYGSIDIKNKRIVKIFKENA